MLPVWYKAAKPFVESGELTILGVVQEQHAERARLYKQWKKFDFPVLQDATTQLNLTAVPKPILIDEYGVVFDAKPRPDGIEKFVGAKREQPVESVAKTTGDADKTSAFLQASRLLHSGNLEDISKSIEAFAKIIETDVNNGKALFGLGVAYRTRFDSKSAKPGDFENASKYWSRALVSNPNQYIWRRRIEQYGPRLTKPYPFYDWVDQAIGDIKKRGEVPVELKVGLTGSEVAARSHQSKTNTSLAKNPDPEGKIFLDEDNYMAIATTTVPAVVKRGDNVRVYLQLRLAKSKWNFEAGPIVVWIDENSTGTPEKRTFEIAGSAASTELATQNLDFEFSTTKDTGADKNTVSGYVLFHCCDDEGVCFYLRKNFDLKISVK